MSLNILQMSFYGALIIIAIILIRALTINRLPKKTFLFLWGVAALRLLVPFKIESIFSVYSLFTPTRPSVPTQNNVANSLINNLPLINQNVSPSHGDLVSIADNPLSISPYAFLWIAGMMLCSMFFIVSYLKCKKEFSTSLPISNEFVINLISDKKAVRRIQVRQSSCITAPLTYGVLKPVILLPKSINLENRKQLEYIINHEYVHIKRFDAINKFFMSALLCIHWFNPLVWIMYVMVNRDIELSCDEAVICILGESSKSQYALTLIDMKEKQNAKLLPHSILHNSFSKTAIEERIRAIMKYKKTSVIAIITAVALVATVSVFLATSAKDKELVAVYEKDKLTVLKYVTDQNQADSTNHRSQNPSVIDNRESSGTIDDYKSLLKLKTNNYKQMSISDFNALLLDWGNENFEASERISHDIAFNDFPVSLTADELAFVKYTFYFSRLENTELVTSYRTGEPEKDPVVGEVTLSDSDNVDKSSYYQFSYHINDKNKTTIDKRDANLSGVMIDIENFWNSIKGSKINNMSDKEIMTNVDSIIRKYNTDGITIKLITDRTKFKVNYDSTTIDPMGTITIESVKLMQYDDGSPYMHDVITNNTNKRIVTIEYIMLAYDKSGKALKLKWNPFDSGETPAYDYTHMSESLDIAPNQTMDIEGGWSLDKDMSDKVKYALYCMKEIRFDDGTVWKNTNFDIWLNTYKSKDISVSRLESYYPFQTEVNMRYHYE